MKAIVTGVSGQDGFYMVSLLARHSFHVLGLTSDLVKARREYTGLSLPNFKLQAFDISKADSFSAVVEDFRPNLIFNFAAKATGKGMFDDPYEMSRVNGTFVLDILEAIRRSSRMLEITFCQASSSEMFGSVEQTPQDESTPFRPKSPYGAAKLYAHNMIAVYRAAYNIRCCSAIFYNHESIRRSTQFVTKKIANSAAKIKLGLANQLSLGRLDICRDWGYAPEYMEAAYLMATAEKVADYVVATGRLSTIEHLCELCFGHLGLDYRKFVRSSAEEHRPIESLDLCGNPERIRRDLNWSAQISIDEIMVKMTDHELAQLKMAHQSLM